MADELWCVHVRGPDDVIAAPDWWVAAEIAHLINIGARKPYHDNPSENWPRVFAVPELWKGSAASHAKWLKTPSLDYSAAIKAATVKLADARSQQEGTK